MKIIILGNGGTGKSMLGDQLSRMLSIPVTHLDQLTFRKGWVRIDEAEFRKKLEEILAGDSWIVEGWSYHSTMRMRLEATEMIIYLAYPIWFSYWNALKRHIQYTFRQNPYDPPDSWIWNKTIRMIKAMWMVYKKYEPELKQMLAEYQASKRIYIFQTRRELNRFLRNFPQ